MSNTNETPRKKVFDFIREKLYDKGYEHVKNDDFTEDYDFRDDIDSMDIFELQFDLEKEYDITMDESEMTDWTTIQSIINSVLRLQ